MALLAAVSAGVMTAIGMFATATSLVDVYGRFGETMTRLANRQLSQSMQMSGLAMDAVNEQMVVSALIAAEFVAAAEAGAGLEPDEISGRLRRVIDRSEEYRGHPLVDEFWITDAQGRPYIRTTEENLPFPPDSSGGPPHGSPFWPLLYGAPPIVQELGERGADGREFSYVGVGGVDAPRIVQVGVSAEHIIDTVAHHFQVQDAVDRFHHLLDVERIAVLRQDGSIFAEAGTPLRDAEVMPDVAAMLRTLHEDPELEYAARRFPQGDLGVITLLDPPGADPAHHLYIQYHTQSEIAFVSQAIGHILFWGAVLTLAGVGAGMYLGRGISRPLHELAAGAAEIGQGNLAHRVELKTGDEMEQVAISFNTMASSLQAHIGELERETARRERLESELRIASSLQESLLPAEAPAVEGLELRGWSQPAREVGGDFFDYLSMREGRVGLVIGDAADKGMGAALLATECWSMLNTLAEDILGPDELLTRLNNTFHRRGGKNGRFVTLFLMVIDCRSGAAAYALAGHNPPLLLKGGDGGRQQELTCRTGLPLGVRPGARYARHELRLEPGDTVLLYSDGVTDARDPEGRCYGESRLRALIQNQDVHDLADLFATLQGDVERHMAGRPLSDDMTLAGVRFIGPANP